MTIQQNKSNLFRELAVFLAALVQEYNYCKGIRLTSLTKSLSEAKPHKNPFLLGPNRSRNITVRSRNIIIVLLYSILHYSYIHGPSKTGAV